MKKLMFALIAAMVGIAASAATVNWSVNNVKGPEGSAGQAGWLVEIYDAGVTYDYAKAVKGDISAMWTGATVAQSATVFKASDSVADGLANGTSKDIYMVLYTGDSAATASNYIVSDTITITANSAGSAVGASFGAMTATTTANKFRNATWAPGADTPEPTSGILLLLGMAGLALRRKRA